MLKRSVGPIQWAIAVFLSVVLWVISIDGKTFEVRSRLPVSRPSLSQDFIVLEGTEGDSVTVVFQGRGVEVLLDQLSRRPETVRLNLAFDDQTVDFPVRITREFSQSDLQFRGSPYSQLAATQFNPVSVSFTVDRSMTRELPISVRTSSGPPERYYWRRVSHDTGEITGAESVVDSMDSLCTIPLNADSGTATVAIVKPDGVLYISPSSITVDLIPPVQVISQLQ